MTLVDSTVWVEFFNASGHPGHLRLCRMLTTREKVITAGPVLMEVLRGFRDERACRKARALMLDLPRVPTSDASFLRAGELYRTLRARGITIRASIDCLLAAIAEEHSLALLHNDADFEHLLPLVGVPSVSFD